VRLAQPLCGRAELRAPWALRFGPETGKRAGFHLIASGSGYVLLPGNAAELAFGPGDLILAPHGVEHIICDDPASAPMAFSPPPDELAAGDRVCVPMGDGAPATILCGSYAFSAEGGSPLLRGLPDVIHLCASQIRGTRLEQAAQLFMTEAAHSEAGSAIVLARLTDMLFVYGLRTWLAMHESEATECWLGAVYSPVLEPVLKAIHQEPSRAWSVAELAGQARLSRAAFVRRFTRAVGEPPLAYLTRWRMTLAAEWLARGERAAQVAARVGYQNEFAFAKAFKRIRGCSPGQYRARQGH